MTDTRLKPNQLAFIALSNEFCQAIETAAEMEQSEFVDAMLRLLPRLYISATDLAEPMIIDEATYLPSALDEEYYDSVRRAMEMQLGEEDAYLEVFEEDMKYSDTPITASISENLADIFQALYNFTDAIKDSTTELIEQMLEAVKEDFKAYWSRELCNVLRALNAIKYK